MSDQGVETESVVRMGTAAGRGVLAAMVLGSGMSFLDGLVLNIALPSIDRDIHLGLSGLQWSVAGYALTLSALLLLGGSLGDTYGRRRIYLTGLVIFTICSALCGLAPNAPVLIGARLLQGIGGAMMVPASLAIIQAVFHADDRGAAIGAWTGMSSFFTALGPFVGGAFVTYVSWRWALLINVPLGFVTWWATARWVPESRKAGETGKPDVVGAVLAAVGLAGLTYFAIEGFVGGVRVVPWVSGAVGALALIALIAVEHRVESPMLPLTIFKSKQFNWINLCTFILYGGFGCGLTFLGIRLQVSLHYSALEGGLATLPASIMLFLLSSKFGALGSRIGPRIPMTVGPALVATSLFLMSFVSDGKGYWTYVFPVVLLWSLGLSATVAPLTASALASADQRYVGVASALNNAASRIGTSLTIAVLPILAGMAGSKSIGGRAFDDGFSKVMIYAAVMCAVSAVIALAFVDGKAAKTNSGQTAEAS